MNVVQFKPREKSDPHMSGEATCIACRHKWVAVAPVGTDWMECPGCSLMKGRYMHVASLPADEERWECRCGCDAFSVTKDSAFCLNCGLKASF